MIRVLLLDLDGTLIDRVALWRRCLTGLFADRGWPALPERRIDWLLRHPHTADWRTMADGLSSMMPPGSGTSQAALGQALRAQLMRSATPDPAVNSLVDDLAKRYRLAIVTNGSGPLQRAKVAGAGLAGRVDAVFISGRMGVRKPDPEFFRRVMAWADVAPGEALIVGDSPREDILGGRRANLRTCVVGGPPQDHWPARPDHWIARFTDLPGVLG